MCCVRHPTPSCPPKLPLSPQKNEPRKGQTHQVVQYRPIRRRHRHRAVRAEHDPAEGPLQRHGTEHPPPRELRAGASLRIALGEIPHSQFQIREGIDPPPRLDDPPPPARAGDVVVPVGGDGAADGHAKCRFGRIVDPTIASTPVAVLLAYCSEFGGARHFAWFVCRRRRLKFVFFLWLLLG